MSLGFRQREQPAGQDFLLACAQIADCSAPRAHLRVIGHRHLRRNVEQLRRGLFRGLSQHIHKVCLMSPSHPQAAVCRLHWIQVDVNITRFKCNPVRLALETCTVGVPSGGGQNTEVFPALKKSTLHQAGMYAVFRIAFCSREIRLRGQIARPVITYLTSDRCFGQIAPRVFSGSGFRVLPSKALQSALSQAK
jgi:hypothetical protein